MPVPGSVITLPAQGLKAPVTQSGLNTAAAMYLVEAGDTLAGIARTYYGDANEWPRIAEANRDRVAVRGNYALIYEKQWLILPQL
jgi:nucleoid-associated protein YgaU